MGSLPDGRHRLKSADGQRVPSELTTVDQAAFVRQWAVQQSRISWLLGAGASAAEHHLVREAIDLADLRTRDLVTGFYDGHNGLPPIDAPESYSAVFARALPQEDARRQYLRELFGSRAPSYGQRVFGALIAQGAAELVLTTNFDDLIERAADGAFTVDQTLTGARLGVASIGSGQRATVALSDSAMPLLIKLHGDFREHSLKNLDDELRAQDETLRQAFLDSSRQYGLAVVGYSGRDASVMAMLETALELPNALPAGLWWITRDPLSVSEAVRRLLARAAAAGVSAALVSSANFDELMADLARQATLRPDLRAYVEGVVPRARVTAAALPSGQRAAFPVLRLNALPVLEIPDRALEADLSVDIAGPDVTDALRTVEWRGALARSGRRVLALGDPNQLNKALPLTSLPRTVALDGALTASSLGLGVLSEALVRGLARHLPAAAAIRERGNELRIRPRNPERPDHENAALHRRRLQEAYGSPLAGPAPHTLGPGRDGLPRHFAESVRLTLEWRMGALWLVFLPRTWVSPMPETADPTSPVTDPAAGWVNQRWAMRRNEWWASAVDAWARALVPEPETRVAVLARSALTPTGVAGEFWLGQRTAFSRVAS